MYRLIIADDEENIRNGMAHSLPWREWGYEVAAVCASGQEVLDRMEDCRPDVVLSDIRMPGMDGVEVVQRLSRDIPSRSRRYNAAAAVCHSSDCRKCWCWCPTGS